MHKNGLTLKQISADFNISYDFVSESFKKYNVEIKNYNGIINKKIFQDELERFTHSEEGIKILEEYKNPGGTLGSIEKKYKIFPQTFKKILHYAGVSLKDKKQAKQEQAKLTRGKTNWRYGKKSPIGSGKCLWYLYEGIKYQGSWEFLYGLWLKSKNIKFLCHEGVLTVKD